jgi:hypothetical protein
MIDPNEKPNTSALAYEAKKTWNVSALPFDDGAEPLPSIFRVPRQDSSSTAGATSPANIKRKFRTSNITSGFYLYVIAYFLFMTAGVCALLTPSIFSFESAALEPATVSVDRDRTEILNFFSSSPANLANAIEISRGETTTPMQSLPVEAISWSETVETFQELLDERAEWRATVIRQAQNERVLAQLYGWMKTKAR